MFGIGLGRFGLAEKAATATPPAPAPDALILEDGVSYLLLEDGVSKLLLES